MDEVDENGPFLSAPQEPCGLEGADGKAGDPDVDTSRPVRRGPDADETSPDSESPGRLLRRAVDAVAPDWSEPDDDLP